MEYKFLESQARGGSGHSREAVFEPTFLHPFGFLELLSRTFPLDEFESAMKLRTLLILVLTPPAAFVVYASACILHATWTDYQPPQIRELANEGKEHTDVPADSLLTCLIWNVGYGGMGEETAFFGIKASSFIPGTLRSSWMRMSS